MLWQTKGNMQVRAVWMMLRTFSVVSYTVKLGKGRLWSVNTRWWQKGISKYCKSNMCTTVNHTRTGKTRLKKKKKYLVSNARIIQANFCKGFFFLRCSWDGTLLRLDNPQLSKIQMYNKCSKRDRWDGLNLLGLVIIWHLLYHYKVPPPLVSRTPNKQTVLILQKQAV